MSKCSLLIASCFLFGTQLCADPIQTLTITSLTASASGSAPLVRFTGSGPSVTISGLEQSRWAAGAGASAVTVAERSIQ